MILSYTGNFSQDTTSSKPWTDALWAKRKPGTPIDPAVDHHESLPKNIAIKYIHCFIDQISILVR